MSKYCETVGIKYNSNMINWGNSDLWSEDDVRKHFEIWDHGWHDNVIKSKGLMRNDSDNGGKEKKLVDIDQEIAKLPQHVQDVVRDTMKLYNKLYENRLQ